MVCVFIKNKPIRIITILIGINQFILLKPSYLSDNSNISSYIGSASVSSWSTAAHSGIAYNVSDDWFGHFSNGNNAFYFCHSGGYGAWIGVTSADANHYILNLQAGTTGIGTGGSSVFNVASSGRVKLTEWIEFSGYTGLYSSGGNGAHWFPNNDTTYGSWSMRGLRGGYYGIQFGPNTGYMTVMDSGTHKGLYQENWAWILYHNASDGITYLNANRFYVTSGGSYFNSDRRLKTDIKVISKDSLNDLFNVSDKLLKKFRWKQSGKDSYGFIAQELELFIPEAVETNRKTLKKSVNYDVAYAKVIASLVNEIKLLKSQVKCLLGNK